MPPSPPLPQKHDQTLLQVGPKPVLQFNTYKVFNETYRAFDVFVPLPSILSFFLPFNLAYVFLLLSNYFVPSASFSVYYQSTCPTTQCGLLHMEMVNTSIQKFLGACIALSFFYLQFPLFLHFFCFSAAIPSPSVSAHCRA